MLKYKLYNILLPKQGNSDQECEDSIDIGANSRNKRIEVLKIAIADGATESSFSKEWAKLLTKSFGKSNLHLRSFLLNKTLPRIRNEWLTYVNQQVLPWYAQEKASKGAFSTFLGLRIDLVKHLYNVIAIGDCCLFHLRGNSIKYIFPVKQSNDFGNNPYLLSSIINEMEDLDKYLIEGKNDLIKGDIIFLMSDALAHWFFKSWEEDRQPWKEILENKGKNLMDNTMFKEWLDMQRIMRSVKNDDVVLAIIEIL